MKTYSFYESATGIFTGGRVMLDQEMLALNVPAGCGALEGVHDPQTVRLDLATGEVVAYDAPPPAIDLVAQRVRAQRDGLLRKSDWIVTRSTERGDPVPTEWVSYRNALRDVPTQTGFPRDVVWPEMKA